MDGLSDGGDGLIRLHHHLLRPLQGLGHLTDDLAAPLSHLDGVLNEALGGLRRLIGLGGQIAHLVGHHGKALAGGSGPGSLHRRIQRQDIGLEGDVFNGSDNLANLLGRIGNIVHGRHHLLHLIAAQGDLLAGELSAALGIGGSLHIAGRALGQIVHRSVQLLHGAGLLRGALGQSLGSAGQLLGMAGYPLLRLNDTGHSVRDGDGKAAQRLLNGLEVADIPGRGRHVKITLGQLGHHPVDVLHVLLDAAHGLLQSLDQLTQFVLGMVVKAQGQASLLKRLGTVRNAHQRLHHIPQHVYNQAD